MAITSTGIGSGLDVDGIVTQLMSLERAPLTALTRKETVYQAKISALGLLSGALSSLQSAASALVPATGTTATDKFSVYKALVTDAAVASASAASSAVAGTYTLEVTQLAQQHRIVTSSTATPFSGTSGTLSTGGTLNITLDTKAGSTTPSKTSNVTLASGATPEAVRDAINAANAGVSATIVNGTAGKQLVLVGNTPGAEQFIKLSGVAALAYDPNSTPVPATDAFQETQVAQGSAFKLNGIEATASSNTVTTAIDGLTLTLSKKSEAAVPTTITVTRETTSLTSAVNAFIKAYNEVNTTATSLGSYNATTKVAGTLNGDSTVRTAQSILRSTLNNVPSELSGASLRTLSSIGVILQKDGSLALNSDKLKKAIEGNLSSVANLVAAYGGAFKAATEDMVSGAGSIAARTDGLKAQIKGLGKQSEAIAARLAQIETRYRKEFSALDTAMAQMSRTSSFLTQQLANLPSASRN